MPWSWCSARGGGRAWQKIPRARFCCARLPAHHVCASAKKHLTNVLVDTLLFVAHLLSAIRSIRLLVSGGHNMAVLTRGVGSSIPWYHCRCGRTTFGDQVGQHIILGSTIDDSIGEAFDKTVLLSVQILGICLPCCCSVKFYCKARVLGITQVLDSSNLLMAFSRKNGGMTHFLSSFDMFFSRDSQLKGTRL